MEIKGQLYIVGTPIGNLEDITFRALRTLKEVDLIAAEDTRHTIKLLNHFDIKKKLTSYYEHNKKEKGEYLISKLCEGLNIALVSDAGLPGISDPGYDLVVKAKKEDIKVIPIPGPNAALTALIASGLNTEKFYFEGFLPRDKKENKQRLEAISNIKSTIIIYEAPHRLLNTLKAILKYLGNREICIAREITKKYEDIKKDQLINFINYYENNESKGEFVIIIEGKLEETEEKTNIEDLVKQVLDLQSLGYDKKEIIKDLAHKNNIPKRDLYNAVLQEIK